MRALFASILLAGCGAEAAPAAPHEPAASPVLEAREEAPEPDWIDVDAASVGPALAAHPARVLMVNVWSTWCEPCVEEMPTLVRVARAHEARGLGLVLIAADAPSNRGAARAFLREQGAPWPSWFKVGSDDPFIRALHAEWSGGLPATLLLDERRRVTHFWEAPVTEDDLRAPLERLLGGDEG
ncbi:MAG: TlpA family protein disulfide reductase [Sandaracinaceae bacterium]|nr:TlpA family protein disulfide reductase [Sandaracinaceae bacterium]